MIFAFIGHSVNSSLQTPSPSHFFLIKRVSQSTLPKLQTQIIEAENDEILTILLIFLIYKLLNYRNIPTFENQVINLTLFLTKQTIV